MTGDELSMTEETGRLAEEALGCRLHRTEPHYRADGHVQVPTHPRSLMLATCCLSPCLLMPPCAASRARQPPKSHNLQGLGC